MSNPGRRHRLVLYMYILDRWRRLIFFIGLVLLALPAGLQYLPQLTPLTYSYDITDTSMRMVINAGLFSLGMVVFLAIIRYFAYVQPYENHLLMVTPFFKLKISYRRIRQAGTVKCGRLFSPSHRWSRGAIIRSLSPITAIVLDLNGMPLPRLALSLFLSPLFFPDKTPRIALLVPDWIAFSNELESFRSAWNESARKSVPDSQQSFYPNLSFLGNDFSEDNL